MHILPPGLTIESVQNKRKLEICTLHFFTTRGTDTHVLLMVPISSNCATLLKKMCKVQFHMICLIITWKDINVSMVFVTVLSGNAYHCQNSVILKR